jgi:hypothetical protein
MMPVSNAPWTRSGKFWHSTLQFSLTLVPSDIIYLTSLNDNFFDIRVALGETCLEMEAIWHL